MKSVAFLVQKILCNFFSMQKVADLRKIQKNVMSNLTFTFDVVSKKVITLLRTCLVLKTKKVVNFRKTCFFVNEAALHTQLCGNIWRHKCLSYILKL